MAAVFTLPLAYSAPLAAIFLIVPWVLSKFVFKYGVLLIMPGPTPEMEQFWMGTCWFADDLDTFEGLGIGFVYKYKSGAKHAYQMLRAWNYGKYVDDEGNIRVSIIREGQGRYVAIFYPGDRVQSQVEAEMKVRQKTGPHSEINVRTMRPFIWACLDYSKDVPKQEMVDTLIRMEYLLLKTFYIEDDKIKEYAKRPFRLKCFLIADRTDQQLGELESQLAWEDPLEQYPKDLLRIIKRVRSKQVIP